MLEFEPSVLRSRIQFKYSSEKLLLIQKQYVTSEAATSHNVLYYKQRSIACYQVSFYANMRAYSIVHGDESYSISQIEG